jgi:hypothetical protein
MNEPKTLPFTVEGDYLVLQQDQECRRVATRYDKLAIGRMGEPTCPP